MSTKIYNAWKIKNLKIEDFFEFTSSLKKEVRSLQEERYKNSILTLCTRMKFYEHVMKTNKVNFRHPFYDTAKKISRLSLAKSYLEEKQRSSEIKNSMDDFYFHVIALYKNGSVYLLARGLKEDYLDGIKKVFPNAQSYDYWNNSDGPDDISTSDWKKRGKEWDDVLGNHSNPSNCNNAIKIEFNFDIGVRNFMPRGIESIPPSLYKEVLEKEALSIARDIVIEENRTDIGYYRTEECKDLSEAKKKELLSGFKKPTLDDLFKEEVEIVTGKTDGPKPFYLIIFEN